MKKYAMETGVGVFVLIGLLCVGYLTIRLGKMEVMGPDTYPLKARFSSVAGLKAGSTVVIAGVEVGKVSRISLDPQRMEALVDLQVKNGIRLSEDTIASIKTSGLIGDKYVQLSSGGMETILAPGSTITDTESALDIESLVSKYAFGSVDKKKGEAEQPAEPK